MHVQTGRLSLDLGRRCTIEPTWDSSERDLLNFGDETFCEGDLCSVLHTGLNVLPRPCTFAVGKPRKRRQGAPTPSVSIAPALLAETSQCLDIGISVKRHTQVGLRSRRSL
jgi:hypothetical protein